MFGFSSRLVGTFCLLAGAPLVACSDDGDAEVPATTPGGGGGGATNEGGGPPGSGGMSEGGENPGGGVGGSPATGGTGAGGTGDGGSTAGGSPGGGAAGEGGAPAGGAGGMAPTYASCDDGPPPPMKLTEVAGGLSSPLYVTSAPGDSSMLYVLEKEGAVKRFDPNDDDPDEATELLTLDVYSESESGLLGMAFHPEFGQGDNKRLFLSYISTDRNNVVEEYTLDGDTLTVVPNSRSVDDSQPRGNHNGGMIEFGPDGYLYVGIGDGGAQNDGEGNVRNFALPLGKILRVDVDNIDTPPAGNRNGADEDTRIFHWGFRNPWRFSFDMATGDLYIADVGQNAWEEVTIVAGDLEGSDFGWPALEGTHPCNACTNNKPPVSDDMIPPQIEYEHVQTNQGGGSITGGYVYRGKAIPEMVGRYTYADFVTKKIWVRTFDGEKVCPEQPTDEVTDDIHPDTLNIASFGQDADGEVYVVNNFGPGAVYRIDPD